MPAGHDGDRIFWCRSAGERALNADLSSASIMQASPPDLAQVRLDNALLLFEEFVRSTARYADAATLRGLERRFAERVQIQPSYWSQIKSRSRQIGERLARQFEQLMHKPRGWMDVSHAALASASNSYSSASGEVGAQAASDAGTPRDDDERFIVGLVLTYYRRHPQRARTRLLDLLGEVLVPEAEVGSPARATTSGGAGTGAARAAPARAPSSAPEVDEQALWRRAQSGVAPLKRKE